MSLIWTHLVGPTSQMLHTKFQGHQPSGSGEDFKGFLPYMGMSAILVMWTKQFAQILANLLKGVFIWNLSSIGPMVSEKTMF